MRGWKRLWLARAGRPCLPSPSDSAGLFDKTADPFEIFGRVHTGAMPVGTHDPNGNAMFQQTELFKLFKLFQA